MDDLVVPDALRHMIRNIHMEELDEAEKDQSLNILIQAALNGVGPDEAASARDFLRSFIASGPTLEGWIALWDVINPHVYFDNVEAGEFLRMLFAGLLKRMEREPYLTGELSWSGR